MRIIAITIRRYRQHKHLEIELDPHRNLIGGDNEVGKSTIVEAVHRALFLSAKGATGAHTAMRSNFYGTPPEVELKFEARGRIYLSRKVFAGAKGSATLSEQGGRTFRDSEAEEKLAEILGVEALGTGRGAANKCDEQWAHLWVWQGSASKDPAAAAAGQIENLFARLQSIGGAAMLQSELDASVASLVKERRDALLTLAGAPKAGTDLHRASGAVKDATAALASARATLHGLDVALREHDEATATIARCRLATEQSKAELADIEKKLEAVAELRQLSAEEKRELDALVLASSQFDEADRRIREMREAISRTSESLAEKEREIEKLEAILDIRRQDAKRAEDEYQRALAGSQLARQRRDLAAAHLTQYERRSQREPLAIRHRKIQTLRTNQAEVLAAIAKLPAIEAKDLEALNRLETERSNAQSALDAMAARLELLASDLTVLVGGVKLEIGEPRLLDEDTEVVIGDHTHLRVRPGGTEGLSAIRKRLTDASSMLARTLSEIGAPSIEAASAILEERRDLESRSSVARAKLDELGAETIEDELANANALVASAEAEVSRRAPSLPDFPAPGTEKEARALHTAASRECEENERSEKTRKDARDAASQAALDALALLERQRQAIASDKRDQDQRLGGLRALLATHGEDEERARIAGEMAEKKTQLTARLDALESKLEELRADDLELGKASRLRAIDNASQELAEAETLLAGARARLQMDGVSDPRQAALIAEERLRFAEEEERRYRLHVDATRILSDIFAEEQQAAADRLTRPLVEKVQAYVRRLFGPSATVRLSSSASGLTGIALARADFGGGAFDFGELSTGAREQLAAAFRLATAEVLAEGHDGCLPIVFDDAFVNSDPERTKKLIAMLDFAASRGLQIIVATKEPTNYATLGAKTKMLSRAEMSEGSVGVRGEEAESAAS